MEQVSKRSGELADIFATVSAGWTGVEAAAFTSAQIGINEDHDEIRRLLNAVGRTKNLSTANDDEVRAAFNAVKELGSSGNSSGLNDI
ncbi:hypothetical protein ACFYWN_41905 [Streptomyces sp. NPDC002917]|uniref:hypothetical protein n=1 Tax=Streptomyces sp. NPDC002917 TaxID=3364671 RepID=UPI00367709E5